MKQTIFSAIFIFCSCIAAKAQVISASPSCVSFSTTAGETYITASGLTPSNGTLTIPVPIKFALSLDGSSWSTDFLYIPYTGGALAAKPIYISIAIPGYPDWSLLNISGGGAAAVNIAACANMASCPCSVAAATDLSVNPSISISPNPVSATLTIDATEKMTGIAISNLMGQKVYSQDCNTNTFHADVNSLPAGVYLVRINGTEVRRFVKQ